MATISDADVSIDALGNIRWTGAATTNRHTVLEFIQWLQDKQDDDVAVGDDILDITVDTPFSRSTDQILTLNSPFNIDDTFAKHLYDGSVSQTPSPDLGETLYSGLNVLGPVASGTEYMILQAGKVLSSFWGTGINAVGGTSAVFSRHLVKSKDRGSQIDGQRIVVLVRDYLSQFRRFPATLGTGNTVAAVANALDIFNETADATIAALTTITNTEGFQLIDVDNDATDEEYYSQWVKAANSINDVYERSKWISQRSHDSDVTTTATGTDFVIDNGTISGVAQSFKPFNTGGTEWLTEARFQIKKGAETAAFAGTIYAELYDSDDLGTDLTSKPTGAVLARSEPVLVSAIASLSVYQEVIFRFNRFNPDTGADQYASLALANAEYFIALRHDEGTATEFFHVDGAVATTDSTQNYAHDTAGWTGVDSDVQLTVKSSFPIHGVPGEIFQGINVEVPFTAETGDVPENDFATWGTRVVYDTLAVSTFKEGEHITIATGATLKTGGQVLFDNGATDMIVALDSPSAAIIADGDLIVGLDSGTTATMNTAPTNEDLGGGYGIVLAKDDNGTTGEVYLQVLSGVDPVSTSLIYAEADPFNQFITAGAPTTRTLNPEYLGTSTGSNIIGAYGIGFDKDDVGASDLLRALDNLTYTPPNNVIFTVSTIVSGEDRVLVGPRTGTTLDRGQWLLSTTLSASVPTGETVVVVKTGTDTVNWTSPDDINWPATGIGTGPSRLRVERDDGIYARLPYDSHNSLNTFTLGTPDTGITTIDVSAGLTFVRDAGSFLDDGFQPGCVITSTGFATGTNSSTYVAQTVTDLVITVSDTTGMATEDPGGGDEQIVGVGWEFANGETSTGFGAATAGTNEVFIAFIDILATATTATFTGVHTPANDRNLFVRVRDGGNTPIKTFESDSATFTSTAQTVAATRTVDV